MAKGLSRKNFEIIRGSVKKNADSELRHTRDKYLEESICTEGTV